MGVADIEPVFAALKTRRSATREQHQQVFESFVQARQLEKARDVQSQAEPLDIEWEALPDEADHTAGLAGGRYWEVATKQARLDRFRWPEGSRPDIIVVAHPLCHFSRDDSVAIAADPQLTAPFEGRSLWLAPQNGTLNLESVRAWNRVHPLFPIRITYLQSDWPSIRDWSTPNFYFFRNGELVQAVNGWPKEGRKDELLLAARAAGINAADSQDSTQKREKRVNHR